MIATSQTSQHSPSIKDDMTMSKTASTAAVADESSPPIQELLPSSYKPPLPQQEARAREAINAARDWAIAPKRKASRMAKVRKSGGEGGSSAADTEEYEIGLVSSVPSFLRGPSGAIIVIITAALLLWWFINARLKKQPMRKKVIN
jgi:hypothetical protein